jgi:hypothetical protein
MVVSWNKLVCMVIVNDATDNYEDSTLQNLSSEYNRIIQITPIFSNLHKMEGKESTLTRIYSLMIVPCNQPIHMVSVDDSTNNFDASTLRTMSEYNIIQSRLLEYSQMDTNWDDNRLSCNQYVI